jgi:hypothetical protein
MQYTNTTVVALLLLVAGWRQLGGTQRSMAALLNITAMQGCVGEW